MNNKILIGLCLAAAFTHESMAQELPTASQLEQKRQYIEVERKAMFDPANPAANPASQTKKEQMPSAEAIEREMQQIEPERKSMFDPDNPVTKNAPNVFPNVQTPQSSGIDIEALARQYEQKAAVRKMDALMVFASFTMPRESLIRLVRQTGRVGGAVVFNGFKDNSLKATAAAIQELGEGSAHVQINPKAFTKYRVRAVPAVVLTKAEATDQVGEDGCALPNNYAAVSGDVSLDYALDEIAKRDPQFRRLAMRYARQVRGR